FEALRAKRRCLCEQVCIADVDGEAEFVDIAGQDSHASGLGLTLDRNLLDRARSGALSAARRTVPVRKFAALLDQHSLHEIDYCSIDVAGAERQILASLDPARFNVKVLTVATYGNEPAIVELLEGRGYLRFAKIGEDVVFRRRDVQRLAHTTVICAVWHRAP